MWNYTFTVPSVMIMVTLLVFYFARRRLPIRLNKTFLGLLGLQMYVIFFDFVSSVADENYASVPVWALYVLNGMFFALFLARIFWFYRFTVDLLSVKRNPLLRHVFRIPFIVSEAMVLMSFVNGAVFGIGPEGYHRGPFYNIIYVCFFFYLALSLALVLLNARHLVFQELASAVAYIAVLFLGNIVRILLPNYLVMNTFCMIAILIIYLAYLNPDLYISGRGAAFNLRAFEALLKENAGQKSYRILGFVLQNYTQERSILGSEQMDECIAQINQFLAETFPDLLPFFLRDGRYALYGRDNAPWVSIQNQIRDRFQRPWHTANAEFNLNVAFAYVNANAGLTSADRIENNLMLALENAKQAPEQVSMLLDIQEIDRQVDILRSLERALDQEEVEVFLQPVVDGGTRNVVAAEALARIRDGKGTIISPGMFIPLAEHSGHINKLGEQVFEKTCRFIRDHDLAQMGLRWINVNLSPIQCLQRGLAERFERILQRYDVPADMIRLEITEQSMVDYAQLQKQIKELRAHGFQFVLDDYGSGYSNLTRVKHYPFINIKLDMEVVWDFFRDRDSLLPTIVEGFRRMNFTITAEGIENEEMADALTGIGVDYLQGFLFSKPLPMDEFVAKYSAGAVG